MVIDLVIDKSDCLILCGTFWVRSGFDTTCTVSSAEFHGIGDDVVWGWDLICFDWRGRSHMTNLKGQNTNFVTPGFVTSANSLFVCLLFSHDQIQESFVMVECKKFIGQTVAKSDVQVEARAYLNKAVLEPHVSPMVIAKYHSTIINY